MASVDNSVIKKTQDTLGKYVTKPQLTGKLLNKPPFKFLRDILKTVIADNGIFNGLYTEDELSSDNIKDKDSKIAFLQKVIDATAFATGEDFSVRPNKVVAGNEADKTNEWLQGIARILDQQVDTTEAVQLVLSGSKPKKVKKAEKEKTSKKDKERSRSKDGESSKRAKDRKGKDEKSRKEKDGKERGKRDKEDRGKREKKRATDSKPSVSQDGGENSGISSQPPNEGNLEQDPSVEPLVNGHSSLTEDITSSLPTSLPTGIHSALDDPGIGSGPASLLQINESADQLPDQNEGNFNDVDPAILKAMAPNGVVEDPIQREPTSEQPDSGVGSLESPKEPDPVAQPSPRPPPPQVNSTPPGTAPLKAMQQFEGAMPSADQVVPPPSTGEEFVERPKTGSGTRPRTGLRSARPPSARPAPPRVRERKEIPKEELPRPATSKPVANVILDSKSGKDEDDDDGFMVEDKPIVVDDDSNEAPIGSGEGLSAEQQQLVEEGGEGAGLLVAQILDTKKDLEDGRKAAFSPETPGHRRVQFEESMQSEAVRKKERELIQKDVQKLSQSIQTLTRSVNPLSKMLDYLQEDLDSMHKELETWRLENKTLSQTLKREHNQTDISLEPLQAQLKDLDGSIYDQQDKISAVKSSIVRNTDRISRLMAGINT